MAHYDSQMANFVVKSIFLAIRWILPSLACFPLSSLIQDDAIYRDWLNLTILHTNDIHSHIESVNQNVQPCSEIDLEKNQCWGGMARLITAISEYRNRFPDSLLFDAGDQLQGTLWYTALKWHPTSLTMNLMNYTAATLGNHEFDDGDHLLAEYLNHVTYPILACNIDASKSEIDLLFQPYRIVQVSGHKIAVIGYTTPETVSLASPSDKVIFYDEIQSIKATIAKIKLKYTDVDIFIGLGHSGVNYDRKVCLEVPEIDLVIGGHSHTFLYNGRPPLENPLVEGPYPIVVQKPENPSKTCLVVQASAYSKYLGLIHISFDPFGEISTWHGQPVLTDSDRFPENPTIRDILEPLKQNLSNMAEITVAETLVPLKNVQGICRVTECRIGNLVADSFLEYAKDELGKMINPRNGTLKSFPTDLNRFLPIRGLSVMNGGGLRHFKAKPNSTITFGALQTLLPWQTTLKFLFINGSTLLRIFERSIENFSTSQRHGKFLQVSKNVRITYGKKCNSPNKYGISSLKIGCLINCVENELEELDLSENYILVTSVFVANGGDGYKMLRESAIDLKGPDHIDIDIVVDYLRRHSPIDVDLEGRIKFQPDEPLC